MWPGADELEDAEIVGAAQAALTTIVDQANEEMRSGDSPEVRRFAAEVTQELEPQAQRLDALERGAALDVVRSSTSYRLLATSADVVRYMHDTPATDALFLDARVSAADRVVPLLDGCLIPRARHADLRLFLRELSATLSREASRAASLTRAQASGSTAAETP
jgi:hypothetical protein